MKNLALCFTLILFIGCSENVIKEKKENSKTEEKIYVDSLRQIKEEEKQHLVQKETEIIVADQITILPPSSILWEERKEYEGKVWLGLYDNNHGSVTCLDTRLNIDKKNMDFEFDHKGSNLERPIVLISGIKNLDGKQVESYSDYRQLLPGDSLQLGDYNIRALGSMEGQKLNSIRGYQLVISGVKNGAAIEQVFFETEYFDDAMVGLIWAGDLDQDGIPDLYMDTSFKYSFSNTALFLSSMATEGELLKLVAELRVFGC